MHPSTGILEREREGRKERREARKEGREETLQPPAVCRGERREVQLPEMHLVAVAVS